MPPLSAHRMCTHAVTVFSGLIVIVLVTPVMVFAFIPLAYVYSRVQRLYIATSRELKRLDSLAFSPIFSHLNESLQAREVHAEGPGHWHGQGKCYD